MWFFPKQSFQNIIKNIYGDSCVGPSTNVQLMVVCGWWLQTETGNWSWGRVFDKALYKQEGSICFLRWMVLDSYTDREASFPGNSNLLVKKTSLPRPSPIEDPIHLHFGHPQRQLLFPDHLSYITVVCTEVTWGIVLYVLELTPVVPNYLPRVKSAY